MSDDMAKAFKAGWKARESCISIIQPTDARDEFYGVAPRRKAAVRPVKYHASRFTAWVKGGCK